ncbi:hypothetical protein BX666DRAFT_1838897, partial [Dichotomocladium elegans]
YTEQQKADFFALFIETGGKNAAACAREKGIVVRTAQNWVRKYRLDEEQALPGNGPSKPAVSGTRKLFQQHTESLIKFYEKRPDATLKEARTALCEEFKDLTITIGALQKHLVKHCCLTLKKLEKLPAARVSERTVTMRYDCVQGWLADTTFCFEDCVFLDEAGFNMHIKRN